MTAGKLVIFLFSKFQVINFLFSSSTFSHFSIYYLAKIMDSFFQVWNRNTVKSESKSLHTDSSKSLQIMQKSKNANMQYEQYEK